MAEVSLNKEPAAPFKEGYRPEKLCRVFGVALALIPVSTVAQFRYHIYHRDRASNCSQNPNHNDGLVRQPEVMAMYQEEAGRPAACAVDNTWHSNYNGLEGR